MIVDLVGSEAVTIAIREVRVTPTDFLRGARR
jgi:hypothetical protein